MKYNAFILTLLCLLLLTAPASAAEIFSGSLYGEQLTQNLSFADVERHWARESIQRMAVRGMVKGYGNGYFGPDDAVSREEVAAMLVRLAGLEDEVTAIRQELVVESNAVPWYVPYIDVALENELITEADYNAVLAEPGQAATRQQAALWLAITLGLEQTDDTSIQAIYRFQDWNEIPPQNLGYLETLLQQGLISGVAEDKFGTLESVTRAQMAVLLDRAADRLVDEREERSFSGVLTGKQVIDILQSDTMVQQIDRELLTNQGNLAVLRSLKMPSGKVLRDFAVLHGETLLTSSDLQVGDELKVVVDAQGEIKYVELLSQSDNWYSGRLVSLQQDTLVLDTGQLRQFTVSPVVSLTRGEKSIGKDDLLVGQELNVKTSRGMITDIHLHDEPDYLPGYRQDVVEVVTGVVGSVRKNTLRLRQERDVVSMEISDSATITRRGKRQQVSDIRVGDRARVTIIDGQLISMELEGEAYHVNKIIKGRIEEVYPRGNSIVLSEPREYVFGFWKDLGKMAKMEFAADARIFHAGREVSLDDISAFSIGDEIYLALSSPYGREVAVKGVTKQQEEFNFNARIEDFTPGIGVLEAEGGSNPEVLVDPGAIVVQEGRLLWPEDLTAGRHAFIIAQGYAGDDAALEAAVVYSMDFAPTGLQLVRAQIDEVKKNGIELDDYSFLKSNDWTDANNSNKDFVLSTEANIIKDGEEIAAEEFLLSRFERLYRRDYIYALLDGDRIRAMNIWDEREMPSTTTSIGLVSEIDYDEGTVELAQVRDWSEGYGRWLESEYLEQDNWQWKLDTRSALIVRDGRLASVSELEQQQLLYVVHDQKQAMVIYIQ